MKQSRRSTAVGLGISLAACLGAAALVLAQGPNFEGLTTVHFRAPEFPAPDLSGPAPNFERQGGPETRPSGRDEGPAPGSQLGQTPEFSGDVWINSPPLTMERLRGKVVLIDFWEYTCINCIRTFADNKKWWERYHRDGFVIIGVHDPEFQIAYSPENVRVAVKRFGLPYPIVADEGFKIWSSYHNNTWPNRFLIDANGYVRYNRSGEGADSSFERAIQELLREAHPGLTFPASYTIGANDDAFAPSCGEPTAEMYVGDWYGRGILANHEGYHGGKTREYKLPGSVEDGHVVLAGRWETDKNGMIYRGKHKGSEPAGDELKMRYHARELYAVINVSRGKPSRLYIKQDGKDLTAENKGVDVKLDGQGHSYLEIREPRMYYLVANPTFGSHTVELTPTTSGLTVNSFTFGNNCQTDFPHL